MTSTTDRSALMSTTPVTLRLSNDRKVTPLIRRQGSKDAPLVPNAFGLPAGVSCPGETAFCVGCYAKGTERTFTSAARLVRGNFDALLACGDDVDALADLLRPMVASWRSTALRRGAPLVFRIHWDGDFYSEPYAEAWAIVIAENADAQFWAYTRSFTAAAPGAAGVNVVGILAPLPNLALYLSVDEYNVGDARDWLDAWPQVHAAYCAQTQADAAVLAEKCERRAAPCPENVGRLPLVVAMSGRRCDVVNVGDDAQGACVACGLCVFGRRDVAFAVSKG